MEKTIRGKVFVVGDNIDTDQIIPAEFLSYNPADPDERNYFGMHAMSGLPSDQSGLPDGGVAFTPEGGFTSEFAVIVAGRNFGCGSSREHAPLAIAEAGCHAVVAESYARICYRNSINGGYLWPLEATDRIIDKIRTGDEVALDVDEAELRDLTTGETFSLKPLGDAADIIEAGGVLDYARRAGMLAD
ncbi:MAG: 3-isopropylmalate dehydratase [Bacteroidetes bacterium]|jgi:3-isopropylmalate/(R)-2-methylmalate dehydratase small subunit|nr:3-isopropylmalate dehydratase [Bacteroidota bacterium]